MILCNSRTHLQLHGVKALGEVVLGLLYACLCGVLTLSHGLAQVVGMASGFLACLAYIVFEASLIGIFSSFAQTTFQDQLLYLRASSPERYLGRIVYEDTTERSDTGHAVGPARA
jgi:hypothetical protein